LEQIENNRRVPKVGKDDERLAFLEEDKGQDNEDDDDETPLSRDVKKGDRYFFAGQDQDPTHQSGQ
jgi:hypothetical protein